MKIVFFDWNGTILDDIPIWYESVKEIFRVFGKQPPTIAEYFRELEGDYIEIYRSRGITASRDELNSIYEPFYEARVSRATIFPGARNLLQLLTSLGISVGLITAQKAALVSPLLNKFELNEFFRYREFHTLDKKVVIRRILEEEKVRPEECCFVGDAPSDIRHGKSAEIVTIAFLGGYIPEDLLLLTEPTHSVRSLGEIATIL